MLIIEILMEKLKKIVTRDSGNLYSKKNVILRSDNREDSRRGVPGNYNYRK